MQPRLQRSRAGTSFAKVIVKLLAVLLLMFLAFFFVEKIDFPSPQKEIIKDVSDKIIKLK
jgi:flagellar biogenesis protein FliO